MNFNIRMFIFVCTVVCTTLSSHAMNTLRTLFQKNEQPFSLLTLPGETQNHITSYYFEEDQNKELALAIFNEQYNRSPNKALAHVSLLSKVEPGLVNTVFILRNVSCIAQHINQDNHFVNSIKTLPSQQKEKVIDYLYACKYDPIRSPLWKDVKILKDAKDNQEVLEMRIYKWRYGDPASMVYSELIDNTEDVRKKNENSYRGRTELPLLCMEHICADDAKVERFRFADFVDTMHDVDIQALKELNDDKPLHLIFHNIAKDARIAKSVSTLNNVTIECNARPTEMISYCKDMIKIDSFHNGYWPENIKRDIKLNYYMYDNHNRQHKHVTYLPKELYYVPEDYWYVKAIAKIGLFFGTLYCINKCLLNEARAYRIAEWDLHEQATASAFNADIKPLITPQDRITLQMIGHCQRLPKLITDEVGTLDSAATVTTNTSQLDSVRDIIEKTRSLADTCSINTTQIQTPFGIGSALGRSGSTFVAVASVAITLIGLASGIISKTVAFENGVLPEKNIVTKIRNEKVHYIAKSLAMLCVIPVRIIDYLIALPAALLKPTWLPYYIHHKVQFIFPKDKDDQSQ